MIIFLRIPTCSICINTRSRQFPYELLRTENRNRTKLEPEYEILDTGVFDNNEYFDVVITYAKQDDEDIFIKIDITNHYTEERGNNGIADFVFL